MLPSVVVVTTIRGLSGCALVAVIRSRSSATLARWMMFLERAVRTVQGLGVGDLEVSIAATFEEGQAVDELGVFDGCSFQ